MKLGPVEGSPEEIKNFFQDNGLKASDFLTRAEEPIKIVWFLIPTLLFVTVIVILVLFTPPTSDGVTLVFLLGCAAFLWLSVNLQLRYQNWLATTLVAMCCLLFLLVALGAIAPREMLHEIKELRK